MDRSLTAAPGQMIRILGEEKAMLQTGLTGEFLMQRLNRFDDDILDLVIHGGLQPYGKYWKPILPPGCETFPVKMAVLMKKIAAIENQFPGIMNGDHDYKEWHDLFVKGQIDSKGKLKNIKYKDGTSSKIRIRHEILTAEIDKLQKKCLWKNINPQNDEEKDEVKKILLNARYKMEDILEFEGGHEEKAKPPIINDTESVEPQEPSSIEERQTEDIREKEVDSIVAIKNLSLTANPINFLAREGDSWHIGFEGKDARIRFLDGLLYIAYLLDGRKPGESMSCRKLYQTVSGAAPNHTMSESVAKAEGLFAGSRKQKVNATRTRKICQEEYEKLEEMLPDAGIEEQEEIQAKMKALLPYLNLRERNFVDLKDSYAQINIGKRLEKAYEAIRKKGMKEMAKHLEDNIKPDGAYGLEYTGNIIWDITIR